MVLSVRLEHCESELALPPAWPISALQRAGNEPVEGNDPWQLPGDRAVEDHHARPDANGAPVCDECERRSLTATLAEAT